MYKLTKQLSFLLLSGSVFLIHQPILANNTNPFVPVYVKGDDTARATPKPTVIYEEVKETTVIIPNMPAVKTQDELGECRAFSLAALMQWHTCNEWKAHLPDCKNLPPEREISYFGSMMYTHQDPEVSKTFQPNQSKARSMYDILNAIQSNGGRFILDSCKPFDRLVNNFSTSGSAGIQKKDQFFTYLKKMYDDNKGKTEANILDCSDCINEINSKAGVNTDIISLKKALTQDSYDKFLYALFFEGCPFKRFPSSYQAMAYPSSDMDITKDQLKSKIIEVLKSGKPIMYPFLCLQGRADGYCEVGHSFVISGYKKVCESGNKNKCKDVFKIHNSWGEEWQKLNNDGWIDADNIVNNVYKKTISDPNSVSTASILWLGP